MARPLPFAAALALLLLPTQACDPQIPADWQVTGYSECRDPAHAEEAYYTETMRPFFDEYCSYCHWSDNEERHGAPETKNFDTFDEAKKAPTLTWARVSSFEMPPLGRLPSTAELDTLLDWLNCVSEVPSDELPEALDCPDDPTVTAADVDAVLAEHCVRCHSETRTGDDRNGAPDGIDWDEASDLTGFGDNAYVWSRVYTGEMPEGADLPDADALILWEYLSCNAR